MTQLLDAAYRVVRAHPGGASALGPRLGKRGDSLAHELTGRHQYAKLGLEDALAITHMTGDLGILNAFAEACSCMVMPLPATPEGDGDMQRLAELAGEFADVMKSTSEALSDGEITPNEMRRLDREWSELVACGQQMMSALHARHEAAKPAHEREPGGAVVLSSFPPAPGSKRG